MTQPLSPREIETLAAYCRTHSRRETAAQLGISEHTVKGYLESARRKLGAGDTWSACETARVMGLAPAK